MKFPLVTRRWAEHKIATATEDAKRYVAAHNDYNDRILAARCADLPRLHDMLVHFIRVTIEARTRSVFSSYAFEHPDRANDIQLHTLICLDRKLILNATDRLLPLLANQLTSAVRYAFEAKATVELPKILAEAIRS